MILNDAMCLVGFARVIKMLPSCTAIFGIYTTDICADRKIKEGLDYAKFVFSFAGMEGRETTNSLGHFRTAQDS